MSVVADRAVRLWRGRGVKQIHLTEDHCIPEEEANKLAGQFLDDSAYDIVLTEDCDVFKPNGEPLIVFRKRGVPGRLCEPAWKVLTKVKQAPTNRGMAAGKMQGTDSAKVFPFKKDGTLSNTMISESAAIAAGFEYVPANKSAVLMRVKNDGTVSKTHESAATVEALSRHKALAGGYPLLKDGTVSKTWLSMEVLHGRYYVVNKEDLARGFVYYEGNLVGKDGVIEKRPPPPKFSVKSISSGIIGAFDRYARQPYCRQTAFNLNKKTSPMYHKDVVPYLQAIDSVFGKNVPERHEKQMVWIGRTAEEWVVKGTAFTTITVNKNFRTAVHKDAGDLKEGFGVLSVLERGTYNGGYLCFPQFRVAVDMRTADVLMCDVHEWHGNTAIVGKRGQFERISVVCYYRANMYRCLSEQGEYERVKNRKLGEGIWQGSRDEYWDAQGISNKVNTNDGRVVYSGEAELADEDAVAYADAYAEGPDGAIGASGEVEDGTE